MRLASRQGKRDVSQEKADFLRPKSGTDGLVSSKVVVVIALFLVRDLRRIRTGWAGDYKDASGGPGGGGTGQLLGCHRESQNARETACF